MLQSIPILMNLVCFDFFAMNLTIVSLTCDVDMDFIK